MVRSNQFISSLLVLPLTLSSIHAGKATVTTTRPSVLAWTPTSRLLAHHPPRRRTWSTPSPASSSLNRKPSEARESSRSQRLVRRNLLADDELSRPGRVRRRATVRRNLAAKDTDNPVDDALRWITSDVGSIAMGSAGLVALLLVQILGAAFDGNDSGNIPLEVATRSNLLAVFACGAVLVNGVGKLDVQTATAESVALRGFSFPNPVVVDPSFAELKEQSAWVLQSVLAATPASTAVLVTYDDDYNQESSACPQWKVACAAGILPTADVSELAVPDVASTPILNKVRSAGRDESYLPTLQALPGRTEFGGYLPSNTQAVLIVPVVVADDPAATSTTNPARLLMVLGSNRARSYTPRDILWCQALAARLGQTLGRLK